MEQKPELRLLAIDDDDGDLALLRRLVAKLPGWEVELETCSVVREGIELLAQREVDVLLLDYDLGAVDGVTLLRTLQAAGDVPPAILWTGRRDDETRERALETGFGCVLRKHQVDVERLGEAIETALANQGARTQA